MNRKGTLMLLMMVLLVVAGIVAVKILPEEITIRKRGDESLLKNYLARFRSGIDLERRATGTGLSPAYASLTADPTNKAFVEGYLKELQNRGFLGHLPKENPILMPSNWGTSSSNLFWQVTLNLVQPANSSAGACSFEAPPAYDPDLGTITPGGWKNALDPSKAIATLSTDTPTSQDSSLDDYPEQNKFGNILETTGYSLRIEKRP